MDIEHELIKCVAFGSAYGKDKVTKLQRLFELDEQLTALTQQYLNIWYVPRSYTEKEFPEYNSIFDHFEKLYQEQGRVQEIQIGSFVEGASTCRFLKYPRSYGEMDTMYVEHRLSDEKSWKLGRHSGRPGWYWLERWISFTTIKYRQSFSTGTAVKLRRSSPVCKEYTWTEVGPSAADEMTYYLADGSTMTGSGDNVPAVQLDFWPSEAWEWVHRSRKWPQVPLVVDITQTPCFLVHKPFTLNDTYANEWYISFTLAEKMIARKRPKGMQMTYFFFKAIYYCSLKYTSEEKEFGSYLVKTTMMWACEEYPKQQWTPNNLNANIRILLERLLGYIDKRFLPHYFIPELNLFSRLPESLFTMMEEHLDRDRLLNDPMSFIPEDVLDDIILTKFNTTKHKGMEMRIMMEISNLMGWETHVVTNNDIDFHRSITSSCCRDVCSQAAATIPRYMAAFDDPDALIKLINIELTYDALRQDIKQELEHVKNTHFKNTRQTERVIIHPDEMQCIRNFIMNIYTK